MHSDHHPHISIVIVNYKVKEYIANLLNSIKKAQHAYELEVFVVDNDSGDDSIPYLKERYPTVNYIANKENVGFGKANNQAIKQAKGEFTLIINPDTLVSEDTLEVLFKHMQSNPKCGAAGCKILNPDGTFAPESRRSIPTIWSASTKVFSLNSLFGDSKLFGQYYMSWLDENEASKVPVLSGSFMFWRTDLLQKLGGFDERFFMYGEDIDLSYRIQDTDYYIDYVPDTSIIHYKGESTKKGDLKYIRIFNKALYQFFDKHYSSRYSAFFRILIYLAIWLKTVLSFVSSNFRKLKPVLADLVILNLSVAFGFLLRYGLKGTNILNPEGIKYLWINLLSTVLFLVSGSLLGMFKHKKESISTALKALSITYLGVVVVTFFVRNLAYTRLGLVLGFIFGVILFVGYKLYRLNRTDSGTNHRGKIRSSRVIIVGEEKEASRIIYKIHSRPDWSYEVIGNVTVTEERNEEVAFGTLSQLKDLINAYEIDQVFFALNSISYKRMLKEISNLQREGVIFKLIPDSMDFILGKSNVEYLESIPLVEVEFEFSKPINQFLKRVMDLVIATPLYLLLFLVIWPALLFRKRDFKSIGGAKLYTDIQKHTWKNRFRLLGYVISGKLSLVGAPISDSQAEQTSSIKKGITGLVQISQNRIQEEEEAESFSLYYLQNYSLWMDIDILIKTFFNGPYPLELLAKYANETD